MNRQLKKQVGFTLVEILVVIFIASIIGLLIARFGRDIFWQNYVISRSLVADSDAKLALSKLVTELRRAEAASNGAYPIGVADSANLIFYSEVDNDGLRERLHYWLDGRTLKRGVIKPSGPPYVYNQANEVVSVVASDLINEADLVFTYYDHNYDGSASSTPLPLPIEIKDVRLIKIEVLIDANVDQAPVALYLSNQVMLRNLKDNL